MTHLLRGMCTVNTNINKYILSLSLYWHPHNSGGCQEIDRQRGDSKSKKNRTKRLADIASRKSKIVQVVQLKNTKQQIWQMYISANSCDHRQVTPSSSQVYCNLTSPFNSNPSLILFQKREERRAGKLVTSATAQIARENEKGFENSARNEQGFENSAKGLDEQQQQVKKKRKPTFDNSIFAEKNWRKKNASEPFTLCMYCKLYQ